MSDTVSRKKHDALKEKITKWHESSIEYQGLYEELLEENEGLKMENEDLQDNRFAASDIAKYAELENEIRGFQAEIERHIENIDILQQENSKLETEADKYKQKYKDAHRKIREWEKKNEMKSLVDEMVSQRLHKNT